MAGDAPRTEKAERRQVAALPWRRGDTGIEILLVTSRETRRWVTPKGGRMAGKTDAEPGERLLLVNHRHLDVPASPYRGEGPIFVREGAVRAA